MKKIRNILTALALLFALNSANAQVPSLDFLSGFENDTRLILGEYMAPYINIVGANLNGGWYNTAKPHKLGGFDITASVSVAYAPDAALQYDLSTLDLELNVDGVSTIAPTIAGDMEALPVLVSSQIVTNPVTNLQENVEIARVVHPNGTGVNFLPLPMAQVSLGLFKGTDVTVRYIPSISMGDIGKVGLFGIGGRHSISQWIPVIKRLDFLNISVQGGYTKLSSEAFLNMLPDESVEVPMINQPKWDEQRMYLNFGSWTLNLIASQSIPIVTVYEGIGFSSSMADLAMLGQYPVKTYVSEAGADFGKSTVVAKTDPIPEMEFDSNNNLRLNAGIRFKLGLLTIHYDFTKTLYATHTAGIGISFR
ncbi:MAG: hypothetical protein PF450_04220 [Bacteroidales bacterium]|jgi:hypothetical protein|nr:hypothetical protein [Bacteroidales bacterium]